MNRNVLVTGANGDIGRATAFELIARRYHVYAPVRDLTKPNVQSLLQNPYITVVCCDIESPTETDAYIKELAENGIRLSGFVLAAGTFKWDSAFASKEEAIRFLVGANFDTKKNIIDAFDRFMHDQQKNMRGVGIGSHAADHPEWQDTEAGYYTAMKKTDDFLLSIQNRFEFLMAEKPGLIDTEMARKEFTKETLGYEPDWSTAMNPTEYAKNVLDKAGL